MNLSVSEAIMAMRDGSKVAHDLFMAGEFILSDPEGTTITDETGEQYHAHLYWANRREDYWQTDWRIVD